MENPICSVVIPAFRAEKTVAQTLDSLLTQTVQNWEALVIIDGLYPDDATPHIARRYADRDPRFKILVNSCNQGVAHARNRGVAQAAAPWIAFLDSDDLFRPRKLEKQLTLAQRTNSPFLCCSYNAVDRNGTTLRLTKTPEHITRAALVYRNIIGCSTVLLRRELALKYPMRYHVIHEDYLCWLECLQDCDCFACTEPLVDIQVLPGSRNSSKWRSAKGVWSIYRDYLHFGIFKSSLLMALYALKGSCGYLKKGSDIQ